MFGSDSEDSVKETELVENKPREREFHFKDNAIEKWGLRADTDTWEILKVKQGKKGDLLGIRPGWFLIQVNDLECSDVNREKVTSILTMGEECTMRFQLPPEGVYYTDEDDDLNDDPDFGIKEDGFPNKRKKTSCFWYCIRFLSVMLNIAFVIYFYQLFYNSCPADMSYYDNPTTTDAADTGNSHTSSSMVTTSQKAATTTTKKPVTATGETSNKTYKRIGADCGIQNIWSEPPIISRDPAKCISYVNKNPRCHPEFFAHGTDGDLRCGCFDRTFSPAQCNFAYRKYGVMTFKIVDQDES